MQPSKIIRALAETTVFFCIDLQEQFGVRVQQPRLPDVIHNAKRLAQSAKILDIPVITTISEGDEYGGIIPELKKAQAEGTQVFEKAAFSAWIPEIQAVLKAHPGRKNAVLYGVETHCCIYQTALDLLENGYNVFVVEDAVNSPVENDQKVALQTMRDFGVVVITFQTLVLELLRTMDHPQLAEFHPIFHDLPPSVDVILADNKKNREDEL